MSQLTAANNPFGYFIKNRLRGNRSAVVKELFKRYTTLGRARSLEGVINASRALSAFNDKHHNRWPGLLGGTVTPLSMFRGNCLEEITLRVAQQATQNTAHASQLDTKKLATGEGIMTGVALSYRRSAVPATVDMRLRRDREDVVVGLTRTLSLKGTDGTEAVFTNECIPVVVVACKIYIDATRLENVLAKVRNMSEQHSACTFVVVAEWDALGSQWHDNHGRVLDSLISPIDHLIFLRGTKARRPPNRDLRTAALNAPYQPKQLRKLATAVSDAVSEWP